MSRVIDVDECSIDELRAAMRDKGRHIVYAIEECCIPEDIEMPEDVVDDYLDDVVRLIQKRLILTLGFRLAIDDIFYEVAEKYASNLKRDF